MKKYLKLVLLIILIITLTGCKNNLQKEVFNYIYEKNFNHAVNLAVGSGLYDECKFEVYNFSEIVEGHKFYGLLSDKALDNENIDRIIVAYREKNDIVLSAGVEIIEFKTVKDAEKMINKDEIAHINYIRYENIVYFLDCFASLFVNGRTIKKNGFYLNKNEDILYTYYDTIYKNETLKIPDTVKYILMPGINGAKSKKIICGENLEKIGLFAFRNMENLEYFEANSKLKSISRSAISKNPKLKTVILNDGLEYIDKNAFNECPSLEYVVIPASVKDIGYEAFTSGILYIEAESKPEKWDQSFYGGTAKVYWGNEWEYNEEGIPVVIE